MKEWKNEDDSYRPPGGKTGKALGFMLVGSVAILAAYIGSIIMEFAFTAPKVTP